MQTEEEVGRQHHGMDRLEFGKSKRALENRENGEDWLQSQMWCPTTLAVNGLMMMMMIKLRATYD